MVLLRRITTLAAIVAVAACGQMFGLGSNSKAGKLYQLEYDDRATESIGGAGLFVDEPVMAAGLNSDSIIVELADSEITRLEGVRWAGRVGSLVRAYLVDSLRAEVGLNAYGLGTLDVKVTCRLIIDISSFELDATADPDMANIMLRLGLVRMSNGELVSEESFAKRVSTTGMGSSFVVRAFNEAMADVASDVGRWLKPVMSDCK